MYRALEVLGFDEPTRKFIAKVKSRAFKEPEELHKFLGRQSIFFAEDQSGETKLKRV